MEDFSEQVSALNDRARTILLERIEHVESGRPLNIPTEESLRGVCGARTKHPGPYNDFRCHRRPKPNGRCYWHGGSSLKGSANRSFKHGRYSKYMPTTLVEDYERVCADPNIAALNEELGLLTIRISKLLEQLDGKSVPMEHILAKWGEFVLKLGGSHEEAVAEFRTVLCEGAAASIQEREVWTEVRELIQEKTRTAGAEWSRLRDLQGLVQVDKVVSLMQAVLEVIRNDISDPVLRGTVTSSISRLLPEPSTEGV